MNNRNCNMEIEANRLPLIKKSSKKERVIACYDPKYKWQPHDYPTKDDISKIYALKSRKRIEKPEIRGWDQHSI